MPILTLRCVVGAVGAVTLVLAGSAQAHITLEQRSAVAASTYKAVFRVGHGCAGSATRAIIVQVPAGVSHAQPMPKAGWTLELTPPSGDPTQIVWRGGPLPDAHYDEFVLRAKLPAEPGALWWRVQQQCENGQVDWVDVPAQGTDTRGLKSPAALLQVLPAAAPAAASPATGAPGNAAATPHTHAH